MAELIERQNMARHTEGTGRLAQVKARGAEQAKGESDYGCLAALRDSEARAAILLARAAHLSVDLALSAEECALEDELTMARVAAAKLGALKAARGNRRLHS